MTMTTDAPVQVPYIEFQRATVHFDAFCKELHDLFGGIKAAVMPHDMTPELRQIEAMLTERVHTYVLVGSEAETAAAVAAIVKAIAFLEHWPVD